ncbi:MAG: hypothetical protein VX498_03640 [Myxococcota bacterium]|nr:hypothetical protein [Myxococcota bacterium]
MSRTNTHTTLLRSLAIVSLLTPIMAGSALGHDIDRIEHYFGASHVQAQGGNGGLTFALAPRGEVTVLSWPSPSFNDQLDYETSPDEDARLQPFFGAQADHGIFAGLLITTADGESFTWLRDEEWSVSQTYLSEESAAVLTVYQRDDLGLVVKELLFTDPTDDVLVRRAAVRRDSASPVEAVRYLVYENLAPTTSRPSDLAMRPLSGFDNGNDFAAWYTPEEGSVIHFAPSEEHRDFTQLDGLLNGIWALGDTWETLGLPALQDLLDGTLQTGAFLAIGGSTTPDAYQVGWQSDRPCEGNQAWSWLPDSAFSDALDGQLSGSPIAGCHVDAALAWDHSFGTPGSAEEAIFDLFLAAAATAAEAEVLLEEARAKGVETALDQSEAHTTARLDALKLPDDPRLGEEVEDFARRTLLSLDQGTDRETGAMVASVTTQPPYHLDWPRDSAFFNLALDVAGDFDQVTRHQIFTSSTQNREPLWGGSEENPILASPPGAWLMNFWGDGTPANLILKPFEIDPVGLALWGFWAHATFASNDQKRRDVLAATWPAIERGAHLLSACVAADHPALADREAPAGYKSWWPVYEDLLAGTIPDSKSRRAAMDAGQWEALRPCIANEDDNPVPSVSIYSTHTVRLGLLAAVRAAEVLCIDDPRVSYWQERADELAAVAFKLDYTPAQGEEPGSWADRADWVLWPLPLAIDPSLDSYFSDATDLEIARAEVEAFEREALDTLAASFHQEVAAALSLDSEGGSYENKKTLSLARYWTGDRIPEGGLVEENIEHIRQLAAELPTPGTRHVGEVFVTVDTDEDGLSDSFEQRVAVPHLWTASLTYLSAMAVAAPERFDALDNGVFDPVCTGGLEPVLSREAADCDDAECGTGLSGAPGATNTGPILALLCLLAAWRRRKS